jgi:RHS repeat-associated protein
MLNLRSNAPVPLPAIVSPACAHWVRRLRTLAVVAAATAGSALVPQAQAPQPNPTDVHGVPEGVLPARNAQIEVIDETTWVTRHSGEVVHAVTDVVLEGRGLDLVFTRVNRSQVSYAGAFGPGWTHSYDQRLWVDGSGNLTHLDGSRFALDSYPNGSGTRDCATPGVYRKARSIGTNTWEIREPHGRVLRFLPINSSNTSGKLDRVIDSFGNEVVAVYDGSGQLSSLRCDTYHATTASTRRVDFTYSSGKISALVDVHNSRTWSFKYTANGELGSAATPAVPTLVGSSTVSAARTTSYTYMASPPTTEHEHNLASVTYPGASVARLEFTYNRDDQVEAVQVRASTSGSPPTIVFKYNPVSGSGPAILETKVTDRRGNDRFYYFDANGHAWSVVDALSNTTAYEYNADGEISKHVHPEGNEVRTTYRSATVTDRFQHGNINELLHLPASGAPGATTSFRVLSRYEPIYNSELETVDQGGSAIFDYQEDPTSIATLVSNWGIQTPTITALGDVNGDGVTTQCGGALIEASSPGITTGLPTGVTGPVYRTDTWTFDAYGRKKSHADAEGALTVYSYVGAFLTQMIQDYDPDAGTCPNGSSSYPNSGIARWTKPCSVAHVQAQTDFANDGRGNVVATTDPRGVVTTFEYNALDELTAMTIAESYDDSRLNADLAALVSAGYEHLVQPGIQRTVEYDAAGNLVRTKFDNRGTGDSSSPWVVTRREYDLEGRMTLSEEALSGSNAATTVNVYDAAGNRIRSTDPEGAVEAFIYDVEDRMIELRRATDPSGGITTGTSVMKFHYDANGRQEAVEGPEDFDGDSLAEKTLFEFDGRNRVHRVIDAVGTETISHYDGRGYQDRTEIRGTLGGPSPTQNSTTGNSVLAVTEVQRDEVGAIVLSRRLNFALGGTPGTTGPTELFKHDRLGQVVERVDSAGLTVTTSYDGLGRAISVSDGLGSSTLAVYDEGGYLLESTELADDPFSSSAVQRKQRNTYDGAGRLIRSIQGGEVTYFAYDMQGNVVVQADGRSSVVQADPLGLYTAGSIPNPGNTTRTTIVRTTTGVRVRSYSDMWPNGTSNGAYAIWADGLDPATTPSGVGSTQMSQIDYDKVGNVVQVQSAASRTMSFQYDDHHRMTLKQFPDGSSTTTTYWKDGRIKLHSLRNASSVVYRALETHYDAAGRTASVDVVTSPSGYLGTTQQTFEWNGLGLTTSATDDKPSSAYVDSLVERTYDSLGRTLTETQNGLDVTVDYDDLYETRFEFPDGRAIEREFDELGRIDVINESSLALTLADYAYYGSGARVAEIVFGNGTSKSYRTPQFGSGQPTGYSANARPLQIEHKDPGGTATSVFGSVYDAAGNRSLRLRLVGSNLTGDANGHDSRQRVELFQELVEPTTLLSKGYLRDADGNWTLLGIQQGSGTPSLYSIVTAVSEWAYTSIAGKSLDHDVAGNRIRDHWFDYQYDAFDRLVLVKDRYSSTVVARYSYDAFTRRIAKEDWLYGTVLFVYDGNRLVEERDTLGQVLGQYVHGSGLDELVQWTDDKGAAFYYLTDEVGSVVGLSDSDGVVVERVSYDAFGGPTFRDAAGDLLVDHLSVPLAVSPLGNRILFQGREYDGELATWRRAQTSPGYFAEVPAAGQYNFRYRYVNPEEGRFTSRDPYAMANNTAIDPSVLVGRILSGESESPYEMHRGNPIDQVDPWGLSTVVTRDPEAEPPVQDHVAGPMGHNDAKRIMQKERARYRLIGKRMFVFHLPCLNDNDGGGGRGGGGGGRGTGGSGGAPGGGTPGGGAPGGKPGTGPGGGAPGNGTPGSGLVPDPKTPPGSPGGGGGRGGGGGGGGRGVGLLDKLLSAVEARNSENPPLYYMLYCINVAPTILETVIERLEEKVKTDEGLPQPGGPTTGPKGAAKSFELFERWKKEKKEFEDSPTDDRGWKNREKCEKMQNTMREGVAMSCTYFSSMHLDKGKPGPWPNLDCREAWKNAASQVPGGKAEPEKGGGNKVKTGDENRGVDKAGSGQEISALDLDLEREHDVADTDPTRKAALQRFREATRKRSASAELPGVALGGLFGRR